nr:hypothetical protein [Tanacetum cinerariifolium]
QVVNQGRGEGNGRNQNGNAVNDIIRGGAIVYTRWIEKIESVQDMSGCKDSQKRGRHRASHAAYTDRFHELARLVPHLVTPEGKRIKRYVYGLAPQIQGIMVATELKIIQKAVRIAGTLTDEALRNGFIKKNTEKRRNEGEPSRDRNVRDANKRTRTRNVFATTVNYVRREYTYTAPKCITYNYHHLPGIPCRSCFHFNHTDHFAKDCRVAPRNVNPINARNPVARTCYECGSTDHIKSACLG